MSSFKGYVQALSLWADASEESIKSLINEITSLEQIEGVTEGMINEAVGNVVRYGVDLTNVAKGDAGSMEAETLVADEEAIASIFSFGLGMIVFAGGEASSLTKKPLLTKALKDLQNLISDADTNIAGQLDSSVELYVEKFKENNKIVSGFDVTGLSRRDIRSATIEIFLHAKKYYQEQDLKFTPERFQNVAYAANAFTADEKFATLCGYFEEYNLIENEEDKKGLAQVILLNMDSLEAISPELRVIVFIGVSWMVNWWKVSEKHLDDVARECGEIFEATVKAALKGTVATARVVKVIGSLMTMADTLMQVVDTESVTSQCDKFVDALNGEIKDGYIGYFNGIAELSNEYKTYLAK